MRVRTRNSINGAQQWKFTMQNEQEEQTGRTNMKVPVRVLNKLMLNTIQHRRAYGTGAERSVQGQQKTNVRTHPGTEYSIRRSNPIQV